MGAGGRLLRIDADQTVDQLRDRGEEYLAAKEAEAQELARQEALSGTVTCEDDDDPFRFREQSELDQTKSFKSRYAWVSRHHRSTRCETFANSIFCAAPGKLR